MIVSLSSTINNTRKHPDADNCNITCSHFKRKPKILTTKNEKEKETPGMKAPIKIKCHLTWLQVK